MYLKGKGFLIFLLFITKVIFAQQPKLMLPLGNAFSVRCAAFSPDGKKIATESNGAIKIWDANTGALLTEIEGYGLLEIKSTFSPDGTKIATNSIEGVKVWYINTRELSVELKGRLWSVKSIVFSPDGNKILTISESTERSPSITAIRYITFKIWDAANGNLLTDIKGQVGVTSAEFSPDSKKIVAGYEGRVAKVWDASTGKLLVDLSGHTRGINSVSFSPDCKKIVTASGDFTAKIWEASTGKLIRNFKEHSTFVSFATFSPDGKKIMTISGYTVKIWDVITGKLFAELISNFGVINSASFSYDGKRIVIALLNNIAQVWDANTAKLLVSLEGHSEEVNSAAFSPDGKKIVTASVDRTAKVWNANNGEILFDLKGHTQHFNKALFSPDGKKIVTASNDYTAKIWNTSTSLLSVNLKGHSRSVMFAAFSPDGKMVVTASSDSTAKIWDNNTGSMLLDLKGHTDLVTTAAFSPDGKMVLTASFDGTAKTWEVKTGKLLGEFKDHPSFVNSAAFSPDGSKIITASWGIVKVWDLATGILLIELKDNAASINSAVFSPDGKKIVTASDSRKAQIWDAVLGTLLIDLKGHTFPVTSATFSSDGSMVVTASWDGTAKIWNASTGIVLKNLKGHASIVESAAFSPDGKRIITTSRDNTCKIWEFGTGNLLYTFFAIDSIDYFTQIPSGYYQCSSNAAKLLHYVTKDLKVITFEQLDVKYNRPDKVLEAIGNTDTALIKSYRKAWEKRIKKLGIDTTAFRDGYSVPEADFVNRDSIDYEQKTGTLRLHIKGMDSTYKLDRFNVWVNESPLYGQRGISIKNKTSNSIDTTITVQLSQGENRVETSITNVNGTESYRMPLYVNYTPAVKQKEMIRFIGIGIDQFKQSNYNLQYSSKDIRDLAIKLKERYKDSITIDTLFNQDVTAEKVKALKQKLQQTTVNDKVIVSYSGHGLLSKDYDYYLSTYAVNFSKPEENGLPYDELENLLDGIPARKKLMFIDACHSGEVDKEEGVAMQKMADSLGLAAKGIIIDQPQQQHVGLKNSFELMQSLFVNVGKSTGATIISAAAGNQFALERGDLKNGVFTYSILEAMNKYPTMKISELKKTVGERVEQLTNGLQKPTSRNEAIAVDWSLW